METCLVLRHNHAVLALGKGTRDNALHGRELHVSGLRQAHVVELRAKPVANFSPKVAPVHVCLVGTLLKLGALSKGQGKNVLLGLLTDYCHIPLPKDSVNKSDHGQCPSGTCQTYLDNVLRESRLGADSILVAPAVGETWQLIVLLIKRLHIGDPSDAVLHTRREARAKHGRLDKAPEKEWSQVRGVFLEKNAASELANKRSRSLVDCLSFFDRHAVGEEPRKLLDGADQAFIWALRAVPGEGRLD